MKQLTITIAASLICFGQGFAQKTQRQKSAKTVAMEQISAKEYTTFKVSDNVTMYQVSFKNLYNMEVAGHLFIPKSLDTSKKHAAIIVGHPMGAVKEQSADGTLQIWLIVDLLHWQLTCPFGVEVKANQETLLNLICMQKILVLRLTFWEQDHSLTGIE